VIQTLVTHQLHNTQIINLDQTCA